MAHSSIRNSNVSATVLNRLTRYLHATHNTKTNTMPSVLSRESTIVTAKVIALTGSGILTGIYSNPLRSTTPRANTTHTRQHPLPLFLHDPHSPPRALPARPEAMVPLVQPWQKNHALPLSPHLLLLPRPLPPVHLPLNRHHPHRPPPPP